MSTNSKNVVLGNLKAQLTNLQKTIWMKSLVTVDLPNDVIELLMDLHSELGKIKEWITERQDK